MLKVGVESVVHFLVPLNCLHMVMSPS